MEQLTYRQLSISCDADISQLQAVLEAAPNYYKIIQGKGPSTDEARSELQALPEGHPVAAKFYYLIQGHQRAVGCIDLLRGYPNENVAFIGLLLFVDSWQGRGLGRQALKFAIDLANDWGCGALRIAVVQTNERAISFWSREGFIELYRKESNQYADPVVVMERALDSYVEVER